VGVCTSDIRIKRHPAEFDKAAYKASDNAGQQC
jgi:hypothetical protein